MLQIYNILVVLTIATHSNGYTFFQSAILTPITVDSEYTALLIFSARAILDFLLNRAPEESL